MAPPRRMLAALVAALALAVPAPALAQSAGDDQYQDPFGGDTGGGGDTSGSSGGGTTTPTPAPATPPPAPAASTSQAPAPAGQPAAQLPYTGSPADAGLLAGAGVLLLAGGIGLRVRLREPA